MTLILILMPLLLGFAIVILAIIKKLKPQGAAVKIPGEIKRIDNKEVK